jgi:hypothetical protein
MARREKQDKFNPEPRQIKDPTTVFEEVGIPPAFKAEVPPKAANPEIEALKAEIRALKAVQQVPPSTPSITNATAFAELAKELDAVRKLRGELVVALDAAKKAAPRPIPEVTMTPLESRMTEVLQAPLPLGMKEPPPGAYKRKYKVHLPHCATRIIETYVFPGFELLVRDHLTNTFCQEMGVVRKNGIPQTEHGFQVTELPLEGAEEIVPPPGAPSSLLPSPDGRDLSALKAEMATNEPVQDVSVVGALLHELGLQPVATE